MFIKISDSEYVNALHVIRVIKNTESPFVRLLLANGSQTVFDGSVDTLVRTLNRVFVSQEMRR